MNKKNFEKDLPLGYENVFHIDAKNKRTGLILNLAALLIMVLTAALLVLPMILKPAEERNINSFMILLYIPIFIAYIVLHELTHGAAYKITTKQKLTFGITPSVAFCGVPDIYVYRRASIFAAAAPLVLFSLFFGTLAAAFWFVSDSLYIVFSLVFATHLGGCVGDIYLVSLLLFKYRDNRTLTCDTGPEQNIFIPK